MEEAGSVLGVEDRRFQQVVELLIEVWEISEEGSLVLACCSVTALLSLLDCAGVTVSLLQRCCYAIVFMWQLCCCCCCYSAGLLCSCDIMNCDAPA